MTRGETDGPSTAWDEDQRKERYSKRTTRRKGERPWLSYGTVTSLCVTGFSAETAVDAGSPPAHILKTAFMPWLSSLCVWPLDDDYSSDYDLPLITTAVPQALTAPDRSPQHHHQSSFQPNRLAHHEESPPHPNHSAYHKENHEPERPSHTANTIATLQRYHSQNILLLADDGQAVSMIRIPWSGLSGTQKSMIHSSSTVILLFHSL